MQHIVINLVILICGFILLIKGADFFVKGASTVAHKFGVPQIIIMLTLFFSARLIYPLTTDVMIDDFRAVGGIILLCTSFSMLKLLKFPLANLLPGMILIMPVSWCWTSFIAPLF